MAIMLRIYYDEKVYSIDPTNCNSITIGGNTADTLQLPGCSLKSKHIQIFKANNALNIKAKKMFNKEGSPVSSDVMEVGNTYTIDCEPPVRIAVHPKQADGKEIVRLGGLKEIFIGRAITNDIRFRNMRTSSNHCKLYNEDGLWKIRDLRSSNGTYVNGKRIYEKNLVDGDVIGISIYGIIYSGNTLSFLNVGDDMELNIQNVEKVDPNSMYYRGDTIKGETLPFSGGAPDFQAEGHRKNGTMSVFGAGSSQEHSIPQYSGQNGTMSVFDAGSSQENNVPQYTAQNNDGFAVDTDNRQANNISQYTGQKGTVSAFDACSQANNPPTHIEQRDAMAVFDAAYVRENNNVQFVGQNDAMTVFGTGYVQNNTGQNGANTFDSGNGQDNNIPQYTGKKETVSPFDTAYGQAIQYTGQKGTVSAFDAENKQEDNTERYTGKKGTISAFDID